MKSLVWAIFFGLLAVPALASSTPIDTDQDGLSNELEIKFGTDATKADSDGDGYADGLEVKNGYNPKKGQGAKLKKRIEVDIKSQKLKYYLGEVDLGEFTVSTGRKQTPTPKGTFVIKNKLLRPKSQAYKVWMPYWLGLNASGIGIHELPEWGKNKKESAESLGKPASHGCIRLGTGPAKTIYNWADVGTEVRVY